MHYLFAFSHRPSSLIDLSLPRGLEVSRTIENGRPPDGCPSLPALLLHAYGRRVAAVGLDAEVSTVLTVCARCCLSRVRGRDARSDGSRTRAC